MVPETAIEAEPHDFFNCRGNTHVRLSVMSAPDLVLTVRDYCPPVAEVLMLGMAHSSIL